MRLRLTLSLLAFVMSGVSTAETTVPAATSDLGNVMFVGDSITHGIASGSWRWSFHKILVDAGVAYTAEGYQSGNATTTGTTSAAQGVGLTSSYGGILFTNQHSAQASGRAYEVAGTSNNSGRYNYGNIKNWLGLSTTTTNGGNYTGASFSGDQTPDTFFMLIGTNDLLSDSQNNLVNNTDTVINTLLSNVDSIISSMKTANSEVEIYLLTIPCWTTHSNGNGENVHAAVATYNSALTSHYADTENVYIIDINKGIIDVANATSFFGCTSMFRQAGTDGLHPNSQGELLIAGNLAKAMGYAGRSVGLERRSNADLATHFSKTSSFFTQTNVTVTSDNKINFSPTGVSSLSYSWTTTPTSGYTVDFTASFGNGSTGGWDTTTDLSVALGNGTQYGILNINEAYIKWGNTVIYSTDMSANTDSLRIAYLLADTANNISSGYYVWLDDQLIGEALAATIGGSYNGLTISYSGTNSAVISNLSLDSTGAYAPTTTGYYNSVDALLSTVTDGKGMGTIDWTDAPYSTDAAASLAASGTNYNVRDTVDSPGTSSTCVANITSGASTYIYANFTSYTGDAWVTISEGSASSWYAAQGGDNNGATLTGNAYLRFTDTATGGKTVFGAVNTGSSSSGAVTGDVYLEFSSAGATFGTFTSTEASSVVGTYGANSSIGGKLDIVINSGTFSYAVMGGSHTGANTIAGGTNIYINGGTIAGNVIGGGRYGTVGQAATNGQDSTGSNISVTGGLISGSIYGGAAGGTIAGNAAVAIYEGTITGTIYGGGSAGTVNGNTSVTLSGGNINDSVYAGGSGGTIGGNSTLSLDGSAGGAHFTNGTSTIILSAGGAGGTIAGNTAFNLQNISPSGSNYTIDQFTGTISGGGTEVSGDTKALNLDNVQVGLKATFVNFTDVNVGTASHTSLSSLGGATKLSITGNSALTLTGGLATLKKLTLTAGSSLAFMVQEEGNVTEGSIAGVLRLDSGAELTLSDSATLDSAEVTIGESSKLTLTGSDASEYTVTVLAGTGTLDNNSTLTISSHDDATFAGILSGTGTIDLKGTGTQTFVGAGCSDQAITVNEGNLVLTPGSADSVAFRSLTAKEGSTVTIISADSNTNAQPILKLGSDLDLEGSKLVLTLNSKLEDYSSVPMLSVSNGNINLNSATISLGAADTGEPENIGTFTVILASLNASADTDTNTYSDITDPDPDTTGDAPLVAEVTASPATLRMSAVAAQAAVATTDDSNVTANGATAETFGSYAFYYTNVTVTATDTEVILTGTLREDNPFTSSATSANATAGATLVWNSLVDTPTSSVLGQARSAIREAIQSGDTAQASKIMSAVAGSTINATGTAQRDALQSQLGWIRNRTTLMGVNSNYTYNDFPYVHMWIEGTGSTSTLNSDDDEGGYKLSSWGGSVGFDADLTEHLTLGTAFSAQYGSLSASAVEYADGSLNSYYLSLFGRYQKKRWAHTFIFTGGWNEASLDRSVNYGKGSYHTEGNTDGSGFGAMYELTYDIPLNEDKSAIFQPLFNASIVKTTMNGYTESSADNASLNVGKQEWTTGSLAVGARWLGLVGTNIFGREALLEVRANVAQDLGDNQGKTDVSLIGASDFTQTVYGAKIGKTAAQLGIGLSIPTGQQGTVFINANADIRSGAHSVNGTLGYKYSF